MILNSTTRPVLSQAASLLAVAALVCVTSISAQGYPRPAGPPMRTPGPALSQPRYAQPRFTPQPQGVAPRPQAIAPGGYPQPNTQQRPQFNRGYGGAQGGFQSAPRTYAGQPNGQYTGYGQTQQRALGGPGGGYAQGQTAPAPQSVPNRNANYSGMNAQAMRQQNPQERFWQQRQGGSGPGTTQGEHLQQWMQQHNSQSPQDQQRALAREPGFDQLPQQTQQRMLNRLQRLNSMPAEQREHTLQRSEQMERLSPAQRVQVRGAMGQLGALPQDRRRAVAHSFRELRPLSPEQRNQLLNSPAFRQQFNDEERNTLNNLLTVSPMLPPQ